ncbi:uncharacterized protein LAJ45_01701 [Morchella importuna]|uniref:DUF1741-domain-containing protein n=1 Tax=Morchella conica CCBAS932 TaxID=1392247 RepID=A0A3N4KZ20_9PEZI|nr:uncharacterized protein LAJ45_01701 [Morchella importuna]KAH8153934.1 hypothetical protein LAJ45_01701 [Morchella importuna]RPB13591.1 DUF1741-domain-containing protein [Morchella conica CCBAS932]
MASPLTLDPRPSFEPKIVSLYKGLFKEDDEEYDEVKSEGFWTEFFLLKCHAPGLRSILEPLSPDDLLHLQPQTRQLFCRAVNCVKAGASPSDEIALDTLNVFLREVLSKKYTNLSSDIISLLTGLDNVDSIFTDFVASLDTCIRSGRSVEARRKAIQVAVCIACGAFQTGLLSYFTHRDLFPALMKYINDPETVGLCYEPFVLLGVLANYNKFEFQNPYQLRFDDFVNEPTIKRIVAEIGSTCVRTRADYISIHDDLPEGWSLNNVLTFVGLTILSGAGPRSRSTSPAPATNPDAQKLSFNTLPGPRAALLLATYDFVNANKLFASNFVNYQESDPKCESPICSYISLTSYLLHHAHRSPRSSLYARLNLLVIRILLEDQALCKRLTSDETKALVRLCRQKQPHLPVIRTKRPLLTAIIDAVVDGINHNLRKKLDVDLYSSCVGVLVRSVSFLIRSRTRLIYHWSELWRCILSLIRFFSSYTSDLKDLPGILKFIDDLVNLIALALSAGDAFLPGAAEYDDLFYKLVEAGDVLVKFRDAYGLENRTSNSISTLISVSEHYYQLISENQTKTKSKNLSPQQVSEVIKSGYETLAITSKDGLDSWERYREADERAFLKKAARVAVGDVRELMGTELEAFV